MDDIRNGGADVNFVNEYAGAQAYLHRSGMSKEDAESVAQTVRSASARADVAFSIAQYDFAILRWHNCS